MPLRYYLMPNPLTPEPNDCVARIQHLGIVGITEIVADMMLLNNEQTAAYATATVNMFMQAMAKRLADGYTVSMGMGTFRSTLHAVFPDATSTIADVNSSLDVSFSIGELFQEALRTAIIEKITRPVPVPQLIQFLDKTTKSVNNLVTSNSLGQLTGEDMKFSEGEKFEGVRIINQTTGVEHEPQVYSSITANNIVFQMPVLEAGKYWIEVRKYYGGKEKELRTGRLGYTLEVK